MIQLRDDGVLQPFFDSERGEKLPDLWAPKRSLFLIEAVIGSVLGEEYKPVRRVWLAGPSLSNQHVTLAIHGLPDLEVLLVEGPAVTDFQMITKAHRLRALSLARASAHNLGCLSSLARLRLSCYNFF